MNKGTLKTSNTQQIDKLLDKSELKNLILDEKKK